MTIQDNINELANELFSIGKNATEDEFRKEFAKLEKEHDKLKYLNQEIYGKVIIMLIFYIHKYDTTEKVFDFLERYYPAYDILCPNDFRNQAIIHEEWAKILIEIDNESSAFDHLKEAAYNQFVDNYSYDGFEFFSFRDFTPYALEDIRNNTITLAHPSTFNDPMDTFLLRWNKYLQEQSTNIIEKRLHMLYQKVYDHIKVRCFVRTEGLPRDDKGQLRSKLQNVEDINPLMWAHYSNNHKGFCIKYKLPGGVVRNHYKESLTWSRIGNVNYLPEMKLSSKNNTLWDALFAKHDVWKYEKEVRLIHYDPECDDNFKSISISENCIEDIYLGLKCSDENKETMKQILRNRNIKLFQMKVDEYDSYKLLKERIF